MSIDLATLAILLLYILNELYIGLTYNNWWEGIALFIGSLIISNLVEDKHG